jgi:hypothetical protein
MIPWMRLVIFWLCIFQREKKDLVLGVLAVGGNKSVVTEKAAFRASAVFR